MTTHRQRPEDHTSARHGRPRPSPITLLLAVALVLAGCMAESADAPDQPTDDAAAVDEETPEDAADDDVDGDEEPEDASDEPPPEEQSGAIDGSGGTGMVTVDGASHEFTIIHCFFDVVSPLADEEVAFIMDGVPPDAPDDVVEPLRGLLSADDAEDLDMERMRQLTEPVLAHGPLLSVARVEDDGASDVMSLQFADGTVFQTDFGGFLEITGGGPGATVSGTAEATALNVDDPDADVADPGGPITVNATCP